MPAAAAARETGKEGLLLSPNAFPFPLAALSPLLVPSPSPFTSTPLSSLPSPSFPPFPSPSPAPFPSPLPSPAVLHHNLPSYSH